MECMEGKINGTLIITVSTNNANFGIRIIIFCNKYLISYNMCAFGLSANVVTCNDLSMAT